MHLTCNAWGAANTMPDVLRMSSLLTDTTALQVELLEHQQAGVLG